MKRLIALLLALIFLMITSSTGESSPATQTDLDPIPTPIIITKELKGEIWHVRCDTMDNTNFTAGGGRWMADISNWENKTSKEGHRSNHCGDANNWVLFVDADGKANSLYQLKSGSTGGTLPSVVYRAPADLASIPEHQLIYDPTVPNDVMTARLINEVFRPENAMPFNEIQLVSGKRIFWTSQNGNQVWHHTGVLSGPERPRFTIVVNGVAYALGVGESVKIDIVEEGLLEIEEIATANYKLQAVEDCGEGNITIMYNKDGLTGYTTVGMSYDYDEQKEYAKKIGVDAYTKEFSQWFATHTSGTCTINGKKVEQSSANNKNNDNTNSNTTTNNDTKVVGDDNYGYISIPSNWNKFYDIDGNNSLQYSYANVYIVSLNVLEGTSSAKDYASNYMYNKQNSSDVTGVTGATVKIGKNKEYTAYQVYMYYPSDSTYLVTYWFEAEDGKIHYIALEGPQELDGVKITDYLYIPESFSLKK